jgi:pimeloyl-ACP methyl ester carboxylesterase
MLKKGVTAVFCFFMPISILQPPERIMSERASHHVMIPSQLCTEAVWRHQVPVLEKFGTTAVLVQREHESIEAMARSVLDQSPSRFGLLAHGMGGFVALEILRQAPERVTRTALFSTIAQNDSPQATARRLGYQKLVDEGRYDQVVEERVPIVINPARAKDTALLADVRQMAAETGADVFQRQQKAIMARRDNRPVLAEIKCPVMLVIGRHDGVFPPAQFEDAMARQIPGARFHIIEDCGHMAQIERPQDVNRLIADFFA